MNCLKCHFNNPATVSYCQKCGQKLDLTADEIAGALVAKAQDERVKTTEFYAKQMLFFSILLFVLAFTLVWIAGGAPSEDVYAIPSASAGTDYVKVDFKFDPPLEREVCPFTVQRK